MTTKAQLHQQAEDLLCEVAYLVAALECPGDHPALGPTCGRILDQTAALVPALEEWTHDVAVAKSAALMTGRPCPGTVPAHWSSGSKPF